jgi:hypothetical protein
VHWQVALSITAATVTSHLVRCPRSVISTPYVVLGASLPERRTYHNARYITPAPVFVRVSSEAADSSPTILRATEKWSG